MFLTEEDTAMGRKRHAAEEIVSKLRQVDVLTLKKEASCGDDRKLSLLTMRASAARTSSGVGASAMGSGLDILNWPRSHLFAFGPEVNFSLDLL
jgi:hypothetical protein